MNVVVADKRYESDGRLTRSGGIRYCLDKLVKVVPSSVSIDEHAVSRSKDWLTCGIRDGSSKGGLESICTAYQWLEAKG